MGTSGILFNLLINGFFGILQNSKISQIFTTFCRKNNKLCSQEKKHCSMSTESSVRDAARMVAGLDFGTTFSGFAFAHMSNPDHIYTFYDWHIQVKGGGRPCCKTIAALYYKSSS
jgi:hypothetical protein